MVALLHTTALIVSAVCMYMCRRSTAPGNLYAFLHTLCLYVCACAKELCVWFIWVCIISAVIPGSVCICLGVCAFYKASYFLYFTAWTDPGSLSLHSALQIAASPTSANYFCQADGTQAQFKAATVDCQSVWSTIITFLFLTSIFPLLSCAYYVPFVLCTPFSYSHGALSCLSVFWHSWNSDKVFSHFLSGRVLSKVLRIWWMMFFLPSFLPLSESFFPLAIFSSLYLNFSLM